jgi:hypothetical protein
MLKGLLVIALISSGLTLVSFGAQIRPVWAQSYTGNLGWDEAKGMAVEEGGNVYVTGKSEVGDRYDDDWVTIKYDAEGNRVWTRSYGNWGDHTEDEPLAIAVSDHGEVYVTGRLYDEGSILATVVYDNRGGLLWTNWYRGAEGFDYQLVLRVDREGNAYVGFGTDTVTVVKYGRDGRQLWVNTYAGIRNRFSDLVVDEQRNVYVTGYTIVAGPGRYDGDIVTIKYNPAGATDWTRFYNHPENLADFPIKMNVGRDGSVFVTGEASWGTNTDLTALKYDAMGNQLWAAHYTVTSTSFEWGFEVLPDEAGGAYIAGNAFVGFVPLLLTMRYDNMGRQDWVDFHGGPPDSPIDLVGQTFDAAGNPLVIGRWISALSRSGYVLLKYDRGGRRLWTRDFEGPILSGNYPHAVVYDSGNLYMAGYIYTNGATDFLTMKLAVIDTAPVADASATEPLVISGNNRDAAIELDGSRSFDADEEPLSFEWLVGERIVAADMRARVTVAVGIYSFTLRVSDGSGSDSDSVIVRVITACDAVTNLMAAVEVASVPEGPRRQLLSSLQQSCSFFDRGDFRAGAAQLQRFQRYVRAQMQTIEPRLAEQLISQATAVIAAVQPNWRGNAP